MGRFRGSLEGNGREEGKSVREGDEKRQEHRARESVHWKVKISNKTMAVRRDVMKRRN